MKKKILYRNDKEKMIGGVCQGLAEYFYTDVTLVRLLAVISIFLSGAGLVAYLVGWAIMPTKEEVQKKKKGKK